MNKRYNKQAPKASFYGSFFFIDKIIIKLKITQKWFIMYNYYYI